MPEPIPVSVESITVMNDPFLVKMREKVKHFIYIFVKVEQNCSPNVEEKMTSTSQQTGFLCTVF